MRLINRTECIYFGDEFATEHSLHFEFTNGELTIEGHDTQEVNEKNSCMPFLSLALTAKLDAKPLHLLSFHIDGYAELTALRDHIDLVLKLAEQDRIP